MRLRLWFCILAILLSASALVAAEFSPALNYELSLAARDEFVSAIIILESPIDIAALDERLHAERAPLARRHKEVVEALQYNARLTQPAFQAELEAAKAEGRLRGYTAYWIENLFVVSATREFLESLRARGDLKYVTENFRAELIEPTYVGTPSRGHALDELNLTRGVEAIGAYRVAQELGITGDGVLVADCDTGVDGNHPAFATRWRGYNNANPWQECWLDVLGGNTTFPNDGHGHGTHVMGTIAGREIAGTDTNWIGVAPNAEWIATNAINQGVNPDFDNDIILSYQWFTDPDGNVNTIDDVPDVVQNSWGVFTGLGYQQCFDFWNTVVTNCEAGGTVITWSAGNESTGGLRSPAIYSLNATQIFSVGAVNATDDVTPPYALADFSSQGPTPCTPSVPNDIKPEISAPGVNVYSAFPGGQYTQMSGTSMAGPHVAGVVALMREACPDCDPTTIKEAIMQTAVRDGYMVPPDLENNRFGAGFIDAYEAVNSVSTLGRVDGYTRDAANNPLPGVRVQAVGQPNFTQSNAQGYYNLSAAEGTYSIRFSKFGYLTQQVNNVETFEGDTTHVNVALSSAPAGVLAGDVVVQSGVTVPNARITIVGTPLDTIVTDLNGHFVQELPATSYPVHIQFRIDTRPPRLISADTLLTVNTGDTTFVQLQVYVDLVEPTRPDAYGYQAYDRFDRTLPPPAQWVEINPDYGGFPGTRFVWPDQDGARYFKAPFPIGFYGSIYDSLTVSCNGWMLPGVHTIAAPQNTAIPSNPPNPPDPAGIIAPFWDDMDSRPTQGEAEHVWYDSAGGRWIFQMADQRLRARPNDFHSWQVHFLDPALHPSRTGDCDLIFVYGRLDYPIVSTVGIERPDEATGVEVLYNNELDSLSWPIQQGSALRFTTGRATEVGSATVTVPTNPPITNWTGATVYIGGRALTANGSGQFIGDNIPAGSVSAVLMMPGYEMARVDQEQIVADLMNDVTLEPAWRLDPPRNINETHVGTVTTLTWDMPQSVANHPRPQPMRYRVFRDNVLLAETETTTFTDVALPESLLVHYRIEALYSHGNVGGVEFDIYVGVAVDELPAGLPTSFALYPNYPNPFNPTTRIRLDVPAQTDGRLEIYDIQGRLVRTLYSGALPAGRFEYTWDSRDNAGAPAATGLYFCRFASPVYTATQKMLLVK